MTKRVLITSSIASLLLCGCITNNKKEFSVTWLNYDGTTLEVDSVRHGEMPTYDGKIPTRVRDCSNTYTFSGWSPSIEIVLNNQTYVAIYTSQKDLINFSITYDLDGGENSPLNPSTYTIEDSFAFASPTKNGYSFLGWFNNENIKIESIESGSVGNIYLLAKWQINQYNISVTSNDESKGNASILSGSGYSFEQMTVVANPINDSIFTGWFHDNVLMSKDTTYAFSMPTEDYSLVAHFFTNDELDIKYVKKPILSLDRKTVTFGLYPQNNVNDQIIVSALNSMNNPDSNNWYCYNDEFYTKVVANPYFSNYTFDNGDSVKEGKTYWFKCEPICWNVLKNENNEYFLSSKNLLDVQSYCQTTETREIEGNTIYPNNYKYSDLRNWLNNGFYNLAFAFGENAILTTDVDNSKASNSTDIDSYTCENTLDKVFSLSYQDAINETYGFDAMYNVTSENRIAKVTDFAKAKGAYAS